MSNVIKICMVGDGGVGKSSITLRYLNNEFSEVSQPLKSGDILKFDETISHVVLEKRAGLCLQ